MKRSRHSVTVAFALDENWIEHDRTVKNVARNHPGVEFFGSGGGFGERDVEWIAPDEYTARALREALDRCGFIKRSSVREVGR